MLEVDLIALMMTVMVDDDCMMMIMIVMMMMIILYSIEEKIILDYDRRFVDSAFMLTF